MTNTKKNLYTRNVEELIRIKLNLNLELNYTISIAQIQLLDEAIHEAISETDERVTITKNYERDKFMFEFTHWNEIYKFDNTSVQLHEWSKQQDLYEVIEKIITVCEGGLLR